MRYYNIRSKCDWDANSYYRMTANVKMLDNSFDKYQVRAGYGWKMLWGSDRLASYYDNMPPLKGKLMTSPKKKIDFWEKRGLMGQSLFAIVNQKFIDVMNDIGVNPDEYVIKPVEMVNSDDPFYMFFIPSYDRDCIIPGKSMFVRQYKPHDIRRIDDISKLDEPHNRNLRIRKIVLGPSFIGKDIISLCDVPPFHFISERMLNALTDNGIKGFEVNGTDEMVVLESEDDHYVSPHENLFYNPLSEAVIDNDMERFEALISENADVDGVDCNGITPLYYAAMYGRIEMADRLISLGADLEFRDKDGNTPLWIACYYYVRNGAGIINFLLSKGADAFAENKSHLAPKGISEIMPHFPETNLRQIQGEDIRSPYKW